LSLPFGNLLVMAISDRTRKTLWARAGGRCSLCRILLVTHSTDTDAASVFGQEAHIVAQSPGGPRAGRVAEVDSYNNLILLCSIHHKQIDDQPEFFTVERLTAMKLGHEVWVRTHELPIEGVPVRGYAQAAPALAQQPALSFALSFQMSDEALMYCALAATVILLVMAYQAQAA
jgi:hypothetical protein